MPTYEYVCKSCGHLFEIVQSMRDDPLTECPECAGELRKVFAPPAISFKGSGFYATDHGKKAKTGTDTSDAKSGSGSPDSKSGQETGQKSGEKSGQSTGEKKESSGTPGTGAKKDAPAPASSSTSKKEGGGGS
ncbi:MAG: FmdB family zinc ribbon protein [Actinomycetota bacterium]